MIHRVSSSLSSFKSVQFHAGFNLVVSEKTPESTGRQTRNSSGKSSLVEVINFVLGAKRSKDWIFDRESIHEEEFSLQFDLGEQRLMATRSGAEHMRVEVDASGHDWPVQPTLLDDGRTTLKLADWWNVLGKMWFDIDTDAFGTYSPTYRSIISYFIRRWRSAGFHEPTLHGNKQQPWDQQLNLSYLLGLDWKIPHDFREIAAARKSLQTLKREAKTGVLGSLVGDTGSLRSRRTVLQRDVNQLEKEIGEFRVLPEYEELEAEASLLASQQSDFSIRNTLDLHRIESIRNSIADESQIPLPDVEAMYREAGIILPDLVTNNLESVRQFRDRVLKNRQSHLARELSDLETAVESRRRESEQIELRRREIMLTLDTGGALDQLQKLQEEFSRQQGELEEIKRKLELAEKVEQQGASLKVDQAKLEQRLIEDLSDHEEMLDEAILMFEDFSRSISEYEGTFVVDHSDNGPTFTVNVPRKGKGVNSMQIVCFDLMLSILGKQRGMSPGFLIHDSHIFDGVEPRQVANAIEIGMEQAEKHGFQYIITINSDQLESAEFSPDFDPNDYRCDVDLTDKHETGGIFGMTI